MTVIDHVFLTRFNLPSGGTEARIRASETWLAERWTLFERYCAPSVAAQTSDRFRWIIYFDPESPEWLKEHLRPYVESGLFVAIFRAEVSHDELLDDVRSVASGDGDMLITTNLDNDDGLAVDFVERLHAAVTFNDRRAVFFVNGLIKAADRVFARKDPDNAFCSVAEPWSDPRMCWSDWHLLLRQSMPVAEIEGAPAWLQVVHGTNVSNRVRGRLTGAHKWRSVFPGLLGDVVDPGPGAILRDRVITGPLRGARDAVRGAVRASAIAVLGKDGLQRAKTLLRL